jgi:primosomal protein N' (replication factor Y) (superfamily II helicase)
MFGGEEFFADVLLPLAISKSYTFLLPEELRESALPGMRVEVQFGKKKIYAGIIKQIHRAAPKNVKIKPILSLLDEKPVVHNLQFKFWEWIADYYVCTEGEVMEAALPAALKLESETEVLLHPEFHHDYTDLSDKEYVIAEALALQPVLSIGEIKKVLHSNSVYPVIQSLLKKNVIILKEKLIERYKPKFETYLKLAVDYSSEEKLHSLMGQLEKRAPKQLALLLSYLHFTKTENHKGDWIVKNALLKKANASSPHAEGLVSKKIFETKTVQVGRFADDINFDPQNFELTAAQKIALDETKKNWEEKSVTLLFGVTGSGKTNIYIKLIEEKIAEGKQVLYLLPEIALTSQITVRLQKIFGNKLGIYHSKFNAQERTEIWNKVLQKEYSVILGTRSSLFLPYENLGLVIVDEEQDSSFKQQDPAPRYQARDAAIYLAHLTSAKVLLGSATPSAESYHHSITGKYGYAELNERFGGLQLPSIEIVDLKEQQKNLSMQSHFSEPLIENIREALNKKEQVILFQNRRGFAPFIECATCGEVPQCPHCDVNLTYHKFENELRCHYCGYKRSMDKVCKACGSTNLRIQGFGTEKIEDELSLIFPEVKIARMDVDSVRTKQGHNRLISEFEKQNIQILVGTQMVTKGLDFDNVSLVGILSADQLINHPDFRSAERAFQLMEQVSGRAGRKNKQGKVIIQSLSTKYLVLQFLQNHDVRGFLQAELQERERFFYPPFTRVIQITLKHKDKKTCADTAHWMAERLKKIEAKQILGPVEPIVGKIKNLYNQQVIVKGGTGTQMLQRIKQSILLLQNEMQEHAGFRQVHWVIDTDPN